MSAQVIGYLGENGVRDVRIPIGHLLDKWQGLRPLLVMVPVGGSDDEAYPVQYTLDGTDLVWHVSDADTAVAGTTKAAVRMVDDGGRVGMDEPFQVIISQNLSAGGEPPVVVKPWVDKLATLVHRAEAAAERAENAAQNWESGTAPNALAFDGKPPSYYLPAVNLLDNPDFAIAQAGYPVWDQTNQKWTSGLHGTKLYAADRWVAEGLASASYSNQNGLTLKIVSGSVGRLIQRSPSDNIYGKPITAAVYLSDGSMIVATGTHPASAPSSEEYFGQTTTTNMRLYLAALPAGLYDVHVWMRAGTMHTIKAIVCYEGTYTADTLPPYVPPDPVNELLKCQRYYYKIPAYFPIGAGYVVNIDTARILLNLPVKMQANPSLPVDSSIVLVQNGGGKILTDIGAEVINNGVRLTLTTPGLSSGYPCFAHLTARALELIADL